MDPMFAPVKTGAVKDSNGSLYWSINEFVVVRAATSVVEQVTNSTPWLWTLDKVWSLDLERSALLSVKDILFWYLALADLQDCKLSVLLWPLSWVTKFSGTSASRSLEIQVFLTEWLVTFFSFSFLFYFFRGVPSSTKLLYLSVDYATQFLEAQLDWSCRILLFQKGHPLRLPRWPEQLAVCFLSRVREQVTFASLQGLSRFFELIVVEYVK